MDSYSWNFNKMCMYSQPINSIQNGRMDTKFLEAVEHSLSPFWSSEKINHINIVKTHGVLFRIAHKLS